MGCHALLLLLLLLLNRFSRVRLFATPCTAAYQARVLEWVAIAFSPCPSTPC